MDSPYQNHLTNKKTYGLPVLHVFGDIGEVTKTVGNMGTVDGGTVTGQMMTN